MRILNAALDSARWDRLQIRADDIVVASWPKSGTTWMQQLVAQLIFDGDPHIFGQSISPWIECRYMNGLKIASDQVHRRILKTHLPADALRIYPDLKYVFIARDPRDAFLSWHRHQSQMADAAFEMMNMMPGTGKTKIERLDPDFARAFENWLEEDNAFIGPFWSNVESWWNIRDLPNVILFHYRELLTDLRSAICRLADFLKIEAGQIDLDAVVRHSSLEHMRTLAADDEKLNWVFESGGETLIYKGGMGRWQALLSSAQIERLTETGRKRLPAECLEWLLDKRHPDEDGRRAAAGAA